MQRDNTMPSIHSHTHCQSAQANAPTQAWQRVCLSNRTTKMTEKQADEKEHRTDNSKLAQAGFYCIIRQEIGKFEVLFFIGSLVV